MPSDLHAILMSHALEVPGLLLAMVVPILIPFVGFLYWLWRRNG